MVKTNRSGLGRGLDALLNSSYGEGSTTGSERPQVPASSKATPSKVEAKSSRMVIKLDEGENLPEPEIKPQAVTPTSSRPVREEQKEPEVRERAARERQVASELISSAESDVKEENVTIKGVVERSSNEVPIDMVIPNPDQPRTNFKREELEELAASIEKDGLLQPILVRPIEAGYFQIIAGERRWQACRLVGMKTIPIRIREADDTEALEMALIENVQRSDLNPIEEAYGYRRLMDRRSMTQSEVAQAVSKGRSTIANALRLLELPEDAQQLLFEEKITAGHARAILSIPTIAGRQTLTEKLVKERLSVREAEAIARLLSGKKSEKSANTRVPLPASYKMVAKSLKSSLGTTVHVKNSKGKNKIEIEFKDEEDLQRLFALLSRE